MALLKECGNTDNLPEDGWLGYYLHGNEKSGYVVEFFADDDWDMIYTFGGVEC